jgi:hypothetical protein
MNLLANIFNMKLRNIIVGYTQKKKTIFENQKNSLFSAKVVQFNFLQLLDIREVLIFNNFLYFTIPLG